MDMEVAKPDLSAVDPLALVESLQRAAADAEANQTVEHAARAGQGAVALALATR